MAIQPGQRPWVSLGVGWILAVICLIIAVLAVLGAIAVSGTIVQVEIILLALALLL